MFTHPFLIQNNFKQFDINQVNSQEAWMDTKGASHFSMALPSLPDSCTEDYLCLTEILRLLNLEDKYPPEEDGDSFTETGLECDLKQGTGTLFSAYTALDPPLYVKFEGNLAVSEYNGLVLEVLKITQITEQEWTGEE